MSSVIGTKQINGFDRCHYEAKIIKFIKKDIFLKVADIDYEKSCAIYWNKILVKIKNVNLYLSTFKKNPNCNISYNLY